jgi:hypothetical protein
MHRGAHEHEDLSPVAGSLFSCDEERPGGIACQAAGRLISMVVRSPSYASPPNVHEAHVDHGVI